MSAEPVKRPVLRYHGGKWMLGPWVSGHLPPHRIYVEAFAGGASVLMRKPRSRGEVINDLDGQVVNLFRVLRDPCQARELERLLRLTPFARAELEASLLDSGDPIEQARRMVVRSYLGFSAASGQPTRTPARTGFRATGHRREGSSAAQDWANYPDALAAMTARLRGVTIENRPALEVIAQQDTSETCFYLDPPYPHQSRARDYRQAYRYEMTDDDHRELAEVLHAVRGMVALSGYDCPLYLELFGDWERVDRDTYADGAGARTECLWLNPAAVERARQGSLFTGRT